MIVDRIVDQNRLIHRWYEVKIELWSVVIAVGVLNTLEINPGQSRGLALFHDHRDNIVEDYLSSTTNDRRRIREMPAADSWIKCGVNSPDFVFDAHVITNPSDRLGFGHIDAGGVKPNNLRLDPVELIPDLLGLES